MTDNDFLINVNVHNVISNYILMMNNLYLKYIKIICIYMYLNNRNTMNT